jgi:hypothetical protein
MEETLSLDEPLAGFEGGYSRCTNDQDPKIARSEKCGVLLRDKGREYGIGVIPKRCNRQKKNPEKVCHALTLQTNETSVAGAICLSTESI